MCKKTEKLTDDKQNLLKVETQFDNCKKVLLEQDSLSTLEYAEWINNKAELRYGIQNNNLIILNNQIYWAHLGINIGSEQDYDRPVLVVRTTKESTVCVILPLTLERLNDGIPYHVDLENGKSTVLVEQIRTISKDRIYNYQYEKQRYATITDEDWKKLNIQLENLYRLKPLFKK